MLIFTCMRDTPSHVRYVPTHAISSLQKNSGSHAHPHWRFEGVFLHSLVRNLICKQCPLALAYIFSFWVQSGTMSTEYSSCKYFCSGMQLFQDHSNIWLLPLSMGSIYAGSPKLFLDSLFWTLDTLSDCVMKYFTDRVTVQLRTVGTLIDSIPPVLECRMLKCQQKKDR